jgi:hypothetical protein
MEGFVCCPTPRINPKNIPHMYLIIQIQRMVEVRIFTLHPNEVIVQGLSVTLPTF